MMRRRVRWREFFGFLAFLAAPLLAATAAIAAALAFGIVGLSAVLFCGVVYVVIVGFTERR